MTLPAQSQPAARKDDRIFDLEEELTQLLGADNAPAASLKITILV